MNIYELDIIYALPLLFAVAFTWQLLMHKIRFRMIKHYLDEGYYFVAHAAVGLERVRKYQANGTETLGIAHRSSGEPSFSWIVDLTYGLLAFSIPVYFGSLSRKYLMYDAISVTGFRKTLQEGISNNDVVMLILWISLAVVLPNSWAVYFNRKRYKYYWSRKHNKTSFGDDVRTHDAGV